MVASELSKASDHVDAEGGATAPTQQVAQALQEVFVKSLLSEGELACKESCTLDAYTETVLLSLLAM